MSSNKKDIRIIQMRNYGEFKKSGQINQNILNSYLTFSYFDSINVIPIKNATQNDTLFNAYNTMQEFFSSNDKSYYAQQIVLAFSDYSNSQFQTKEEIDSFWDRKDDALFFVTMINVSLKYEIDDAIKRIKTIFKSHESEYLIYLTFEYNEIIIFFKGNRFDEYSKLIMELNFKTLENDNPIVDTITLCSFSQNACDYSEERFGAHICLGTDNYNNFSKFLDDFKKESGNFGQKWLLGRNDIEIWNPNATLAWMHNIYKNFIKQSAANITTYKLSILIPKNNEIEKKLTGQNLALSPSIFKFDIKTDLAKKISFLDQHYKVFCERLNMSYDPVLIRMMYDIISVISGIHEHQYAEDLFICLYTQVEDFIKYLNILFCNNDVTEAQAPELSKCVNSFYLSNISLINSTVHTSQQFIQIPHCAPPAFEMPPKIMAYYNNIVRSIQKIFKDDDAFCGIIISPKLVDELEVEPLALDATEPNQLISINISEKMIYNLRRTVSILAHELAHFIGKDTRNRKLRCITMGAYFISKILMLVDEQIYDIIDYNDDIEINKLESEAFSEFSFDLSESFFGNVDDNDASLYRRKLITLFYNLPSILLQEENCKSHILSTLYNVDNPTKMSYIENIEKSLNLRLQIPDDCNDIFESTKTNLLQNHFKSIFLKAIDNLIFSNALYEFRNELKTEIDDYVGYLFAETYADISMILLFGMSTEKYLSLITDKATAIYRANINEDKTELMRYIAVATSLNRCCIWKSFNSKKVFVKDSWSDVIYTFFSAINSEQDFSDLLDKYDIDVILLQYLIRYLNKCIEDIDLKLNHKSKDVAILRELYASINSNKPLSVTLMEMRKFETKAFD